YQITKRIGAGGVGEVFKGVDAMLKREVAIKVLRDDLASDPVFLARFRNEAQLQAKLSHPNVASVHAFLQEGDKQFMVMEYVAGISLDEFVRAGGPVPVQRALEIFRRALDGIDHAHGHGIVHRDIKPANIMLADSGQVKVMDFGIARAMDSQEQLTRIGHVAGTAKAMSPEQIRGKKADVRSDIYSLGIVLYTLLAGRAPFDHGNDVELMKAQLEQAPPPLRDLVDELPPKVEAAVMRALEKDPSARFQTVRDFARAIDACIAGAAPAPAAPAIDRAVEPAATASRTAINPALQGVERLPAGGAMRAERPAARAARTEGSTWIMVGVFSLGIAALGVCGALLWSQFSPADTPVAARAAPASPTEPTLPSATSTEALSKPVDTAAPAPAPATVPPAAPTVTTAPAMVQSPPPSPLPAPPLPTAPPATGLPADTSAATVQLPRAPVAASPTLSISRVVAGGKVVAGGSDGVQRFRPGERIRLQVTSSADAHVYCYLQDEAQRILRFYPNRFSKSARVSAKVPLEIPGKMRFELVANALMVPETVACFASERDVAAELPASVIGEDFSKLPAASLDEVRDAFARAATPRMAEGRFQIDFK
ncbi:MAG TPA: serine/threonine-protein kinase, partial [Burkholderiaceae bacterium]|nr:serine/threonine-protein kinase [Burkholderiaceae bacterium]